MKFQQINRLGRKIHGLHRAWKCICSNRLGQKVNWPVPNSTHHLEFCLVISCQKYFCQVAKFGEDIKLQPSYYDMKGSSILSIVILTLTLTSLKLLVKSKVCEHSGNLIKTGLELTTSVMNKRINQQ